MRRRARSAPGRWSPPPCRCPWATASAAFASSAPTRSSSRSTRRAWRRAGYSTARCKLSSAARRRTALAAGAKFAGSHGLAETGPAHAAHPYEVVGILAPTGTVVDRLVLTPLESVWEVHEEHPPGAKEDEHRDEAGQEITSLLVKYRTPLAAAILPRQINSNTAMQAASPAYESAKLMNLIGVGVDALRILAVVLVVTAAVAVFVALMSALQERRYDLALLRTLGARPGTLFALLAAEGVTLVVAGVILGLVLGHAAAEALGRWIARSNS